MAEKLLMTALSPTMETGQIVKWIKKEGDIVKIGDVLCEVETDKTSMEYESFEEGILLKILLPEGGKARVGDIIGILGSKDEDISKLIKEYTDTPKEGQSTSEKTEDSQEKTISGENQPGFTGYNRKILISPVARKIAELSDIDLGTINGSGPGGRIVKSDIEKVLNQKRAVMKTSQSPLMKIPAPQEEEIPISKKRRIIAERLSLSKFSAPHYYLRVSVKMDSIIEARDKLNKKLPYKLSLNAFLIKFAAKSIARFPIINSSWEGDFIRRFKSIDIGLAVAQEDGLIAPVIRNLSHKGIIAIDQELKELVKKARDGTLALDEYTNSTFTITNLGNYGIEEFTAIINPPGSAIMAVGEIVKQPIVTENGEIQVRRIMKITLSCDHRVIDGAIGAQFLKSIKDMMENPIEVLY